MTSRPMFLADVELISQLARFAAELDPKTNETPLSGGSRFACSELGRILHQPEWNLRRFRRNPIAPSNPDPSKTIEVGSGTALGVLVTSAPDTIEI